MEINKDFSRIGGSDKDIDTYTVAVKCMNCNCEYYATLKKGVWVSQAYCINCNNKTLKNN